MDLNAEQIKKALECCVTDSCFSCPYDDVGVYSQCVPTLLENALALINSQEQRIKELTEENEAWQKALITEKENADKAYYELACEVENLRDENERLRAELEKRPPKLIITKLQKETELNATEDKL